MVHGHREDGSKGSHQKGRSAYPIENVPRALHRIQRLPNRRYQFPDIPKCPAFTETEMTGLARRIVAQMPQPPIISEGQRRPLRSSLDTVEMPSRETFRAEWRFTRRFFHELAHSTGHENDLNRAWFDGEPGRMYAAGETRKIYCLEELVAEMAAAAFLGAPVQDGDENSAAYLQGWSTF